MTQFIRIDGQIINLGLVIHAQFIPAIKDELAEQPCVVVLSFAGNSEKFCFQGAEAECFWNCLKKSSLQIYSNKSPES